MRQARIDKNGMIKIPDDFLEMLKLNVKDGVSVETVDDRIIIRKAIPFCRICKSTNVIEGFEVCKKCVCETERKLRDEKMC